MIDRSDSAERGTTTSPPGRTNQPGSTTAKDGSTKATCGRREWAAASAEGKSIGTITVWPRERRRSASWPANAGSLWTTVTSTLGSLCRGCLTPSYDTDHERRAEFARDVP